MPLPPWKLFDSQQNRQMGLAVALLALGYSSRMRPKASKARAAPEFAHTRELRSHAALCEIVASFAVLGQDDDYAALVDMVENFLQYAASTGDRHIAQRLFMLAKDVDSHADRLVTAAQRGATMDRVCLCVQARENGLPSLQSALDTYVHNVMLQ